MVNIGILAIAHDDSVYGTEKGSQHNDILLINNYFIKRVAVLVPAASKIFSASILTSSALRIRQMAFRSSLPTPSKAQEVSTAAFRAFKIWKMQIEKPKSSAYYWVS